jgi:hypothetical protein
MRRTHLPMSERCVVVQAWSCGRSSDRFAQMESRIVRAAEVEIGVGWLCPLHARAHLAPDSNNEGQ